MEDKIPKLKENKNCKHNNSNPLYLRREKNWISTQKILGYMVYCCLDCKAFFIKSNEELDIEK